MKIAFCILCHKYTPVLDALVGELSPGNGIFVHVDRKADMEQFSPLRGRVTFVTDRVDVSWGTFSIIEASLKLLALTARGRYDYISVISGDTLPLRPNEEIREFFTRNSGKEFVYEKPLRREHKKRFRYEYPDIDLRDKPFAVRFRHAVKRRLGLYPKNRFRKMMPPLAFGSNWVTVTAAFRDYIFHYLADHISFIEAFRYSLCGDEHFFQTILRQSPFYERNEKRRYMYVDWTTGPQKPRTLDESDFDRLDRAVTDTTDDSFYIYARKFSDSLDLAAYRRRFLTDEEQGVELTDTADE